MKVIGAGAAPGRRSWIRICLWTLNLWDWPVGFQPFDSRRLRIYSREVYDLPEPSEAVLRPRAGNTEAPSWLSSSRPTRRAL